MQAPRLLSRTFSRNIITRNAHHEAHHPGPLSTYNDLPTPSGSWQTHYDAKQRKYNGQLALGIGAIVGTLIFGKAVGFLEFYDDIPARPAEIKSYKN